MKDWDKKKKIFVELGSGNSGLDFKSILHRLEEERYDGWVTVEQDVPATTPFDCAKRSREFLRRIGY